MCNEIFYREGQGSYICFIDSDDYVERDYLKKLVEPYFQNKKIDLTICNYFNDNHPKLNGFVSKQNENSNIRNRIETMREFANPRSFKGFAWNKLYRLDIIEFNNLRYNVDCVLVEDALFNHQYMSNCSVSYYIDDPLYHYITRNDSLTNQSFKEKNWDLLKSYKKIMDFCEKQKDGMLTSVLRENYLSHEITILKKINLSKTPVDKDKKMLLKSKVRESLKDILLAQNISLKRKGLAVYLAVSNQLRVPSKTKPRIVAGVKTSCNGLDIFLEFQAPREAVHPESFNLCHSYVWEFR